MQRKIEISVCQYRSNHRQWTAGKSKEKKVGKTMESVQSALVKFFGVVIRGQTYLNALYLLLAFPLGLFYFIFLVTGLSLGFATIIVWVGLLILALVFGAWYAFIAFERQMAISMLREEIPPMTRQDLTGKSLWQKFTATLTNSVTWKGLLYLLVKFPLGILSFVVLVTLLSVSASFIGLPFYYQYIHPSVDLTMNGVYYFNPVWLVDTLPEALLGSLVGILILLVSLHIFNGLAWVSGKFARVMLGNFSTAPAQPAVLEPVQALPALEETPEFAEAGPAPETGEEPPAEPKPLDHAI